LEPYYIVVLDKDIGYCRLFRTDSENCPSGVAPLWQGHNLDVGYEEMIRQNNERREIPSYHVSVSVNQKDRKIFRIFRESPTHPWSSVDLFNDYKLAVAKMKQLCDERDALDKERRAFTTEVAGRKKMLMQRLRMKGRTLRLDAKAKKYVKWLLDSEALEASERENLLWLKEKGFVELSHP
jgi:hypothetical protein